MKFFYFSKKTFTSASTGRKTAGGSVDVSHIAKKRKKVGMNKYGMPPSEEKMSNLSANKLTSRYRL